MQFKKNFNVIVGRTSCGEYYGLDYVFQRGRSAADRGACGAIFDPITVAAAEEAREPENLKETFKDLWQMAVANDQTEDGLEDWIEQNDLGDENIWDLGFSEMGDEAAELYTQQQAKEQKVEERYLDDDSRAEFSDCRGCGRVFNFGILWVEVYNKELLALALSFEKPAQTLPKNWRSRLLKFFSEAELKDILDGGPRKRLLALDKTPVAK